MAAGLLGGDSKGDGGALDLGSGKSDGFPGFSADEMGETLALLLEAFGDLEQKTGAFVWRLLSAEGESRPSGLGGLFEEIEIAEGHFG